MSLSIEGYPFITRFKTKKKIKRARPIKPSIEGYPFITRFKTLFLGWNTSPPIIGIEGYPFITRFKTQTLKSLVFQLLLRVLKAIHL